MFVSLKTHATGHLQLCLYCPLSNPNRSSSFNLSSNIYWPKKSDRIVGQIIWAQPRMVTDSRPVMERWSTEVALTPRKEEAGCRRHTQTLNHYYIVSSCSDRKVGKGNFRDGEKRYKATSISNLRMHLKSQPPKAHRLLTQHFVVFFHSVPSWYGTTAEANMTILPTVIG